MRIFKNIFTSVFATSLVLAALPAAALVGSWSTPVNLSEAGSDSYNAQVTVDSNGLATAIWVIEGSDNIVQSSTSLSGGAWSTPVNLSAAGGGAEDPQLTVDSTGLVTAVWERYAGGDDIIQSSTSLSGGSWTTPVNLSAAGEEGRDPQVTVDSTGLVTAVWEHDDGRGEDIIQSSTSLSGGTWTTPVNVSLSTAGEDADDPELTVDSTGLVTAVWEYDDGSDDIIQSSSRPRGGSWTTPVDLSAAGQDANDMRVVVDSTGLVTAVWHRWNGSNDIIQSSTSLNGGAWTTPVNVSAAGGDAYDAEVTVDSNGLATAIWYREDGSGYYIMQASTRPRGGTWTTPVDLSAAGADAYDQQLTVDSSGLATAIWYGNSGNDYIIQSSTSQSGGTWSTPVDLTPAGVSGQDPQLTVDSTGLVTAVWQLYNGTNYIVQSSHILNTIPPQPTPTPTPPTLAKTGAEVDWLALGSLIAVVAGAGLFAMGRGRRTE